MSGGGARGGEFLQKYTHYGPKIHVEHHRGWPSQRASQTAVFQSLQHKGCVLSGLGALTEMLDTCHPQSELVEVHVKPSRKIVASADTPSGRLVLCPATTNVKMILRGDGAASSARAVNDAWVEVSWQPPDEDNSFWLLPCTGDDCMSPFWFVASTPDDRRANMTWSKFSVQMITGADHVGELELVPPAGRRARGKKKDTALGIDNAIVHNHISVPVLVNPEPIKAGEEIMVYRRPSEKRAKSPEKITMANLFRRAASSRKAADAGAGLP